MNQRRLLRYHEKFGYASGFEVRNNNETLFYNPNNNITLEVVLPSERQAKIQVVYDDIQRGLGVGLSAFYHQIAMTYLNIPKQYTDDFLRSQSDYILGIVPHKLINKPIITTVPNERWGIDLINMEAYHNPGLNGSRIFILTVVDYFSGKVFARAISNNLNNILSPTLSNALADICVHDAHCRPHIIQADSEFLKGTIRAWCHDNNIRMMKTSSYTPVSNGKVERMNQILRRKIKAGFIRNNNLAWVAHLQDYVININNQQNSRNGLTPNQLWRQGYHRHPDGHELPELHDLNDNMNAQQRRDHNEAFIDHHARHLVSLGRSPHIFNNGDLCRIKLLVVNPRMREVRERNIGWNKAAVHYTPETYIVVNAIHYPANFIRRDEYILTDMNQNIIRSGGNRPKLFYGNDLVFVPQINTNTHIHPRTIQRGLYLNRF